MILHLINLCYCLYSVENGKESFEVNDITSNGNTPNNHVAENPVFSTTYPVLGQKVQTDMQNISTVLDNQLSGIHNNIKTKIVDSIEKNTMDREKFRDIFIVKKTEIYDGDKRIIKYDIEEEIIPKYSSISYNIIPDTPTKILLCSIFILLFTLVLTTTCKLFESFTGHLRLKRKKPDVIN